MTNNNQIDNLKDRIEVLEAQNQTLRLVATELISRDISSTMVAMLLSEKDYEGARKELINMKESASHIFELFRKGFNQ